MKCFAWSNFVGCCFHTILVVLGFVAVLMFLRVLPFGVTDGFFLIANTGANSIMGFWYVREERNRYGVAEVGGSSFHSAW